MVVSNLEEYIEAIEVEGTWMGTDDCIFMAMFLKTKVVLLDFTPYSGLKPFNTLIFGQRNKGCRMLRYNSTINCLFLCILSLTATVYYRFVHGNHYEFISMEKIGPKCCEACKKFTYKVHNEILMPPNLHQPPTSEPVLTSSCLQIPQYNSIVLLNLSKKIKTTDITTLVKKYGKVIIFVTCLIGICIGTFGLEIKRQLFI